MGHDRGYHTQAQCGHAEHALGLSIDPSLRDSASLRALPFDELSRLLGNANKGDMVVIAYHEIMWDLLEMLNEQRVVEIPGILRGRGNQEEVGRLVFIVRE